MEREREFPQGAEPVPGPGENVDMEDAEVPPRTSTNGGFRDRSAMTPEEEESHIHRG